MESSEVGYEANEMYYPSNLVRVYFKLCHVHKHEPNFKDMHDFVFEVLGNGHSSGIPLSKLNKVFKNARKNQHSRTR